MPSNIVKSFADKTGKSVKEVEKLWGEAKKIALENNKETDPKFYGTVVAILKNKLGIINKATEVLNMVN